MKDVLIVSVPSMTNERSQLGHRTRKSIFVGPGPQPFLGKRVS